MGKETKIEQEAILLEVQALKERLKSELRSERLKKINTISSENDDFTLSNKSPLDSAFEDIFLAEVSTTVKSPLPKFFNRLLRKQNKVNRYIISAFRNIVHLYSNFQQEHRARWDDFSRSLSNLYSRVNALTENKNFADGDGTRNGISAEDIDFSQFYLAFEDEFRGSQEVITERLKVHLPIALEARKRTNGQPFESMDLGCGRGEWLSLLLDEGIKARGIDCNVSLLRECQSKNLLVEEGDALGKLNEQPDQSLSFITAFHLIEHLDFQTQFSFVRNAFRVLRAGGVLLFETPNVQNIDVGASGFYHDPTHIRPVPWPLGKFMAEHVGFLPVKINFLNPDPSFEGQEAEKNEITSRLHGPRDYALIAYKS
jgi:2-polyprenyl-3-methyl-5-hydroxy-6-metoxy-1,4-benzoquinol methylase